MRDFLKNIYFYLMRKKYNLFYPNTYLHKRAKVMPNSRLSEYNVIGKNTLYSGIIGHDSYIGSDSIVHANIGNYCSIGDRVRCIFSSHPTSKYVSTSPVFFSVKKQTGRTFIEDQLYDEILLQPNLNVPVIIENDVWIGSDVTFVGCIHVGNGAIVATGSIVTENVLPFTIVGGVPAKTIRKRFTGEQIDFLLQLKWWDKDIEWIKKHIKDFADISIFKENVEENLSEQNMHVGNK